MEEILGHGLPVAAKLAGWRIVESSRPDVDFEAGPPEHPILVAFCNQPNATSVFHKLGRLQKTIGEGPLDRLCLVRDPRIPISKKAKKTQERLSAVRDRGTRVVRPDPEAVAAIDAMRLLVSTATSGELSHNGDSVPVENVLAWLEANLPAAVGTLVEELRVEADRDLTGARRGRVRVLLFDQSLFASFVLGVRSGRLC